MIISSCPHARRTAADVCLDCRALLPPVGIPAPCVHAWEETMHEDIYMHEKRWAQCGRCGVTVPIQPERED